MLHAVVSTVAFLIFFGGFLYSRVYLLVHAKKQIIQLGCVSEDFIKLMILPEFTKLKWPISEILNNGHRYKIITKGHSWR